MFTIICCSVDPAAARRLEKNIAATCGCPYEFIAYDNRTSGDGLCKVYNRCAAAARYDMLCFVHEDVEFQTEGWGQIIAAKLAEADCGVIGFAGSILKLKRLTGWHNGGGDLRAHYVQYMRGGHHPIDRNPDGVDFSPVVTLDGMCLFVRREVWSETLFDEQTFPRFHGYDIDFTLAVACRYRNYVCNKVFIEHFSTGGYACTASGATACPCSPCRCHRARSNATNASARAISYASCGRRGVSSSADSDTECNTLHAIP